MDYSRTDPCQSWATMYISTCHQKKVRINEWLGGTWDEVMLLSNSLVTSALPVNKDETRVSIRHSTPVLQVQVLQNFPMLKDINTKLNITKLMWNPDCKVCIAKLMKYRLIPSPMAASPKLKR